MSKPSARETVTTGPGPVLPALRFAAARAMKGTAMPKTTACTPASRSAARPSLALLACAALWLTGCPADPAEHFENAQQLTYQRLHKDALAEYVEVLSLVAKKDSDRARELRVKSLKAAGDICYLELRDPSRAVEYYRSLVSRYPEDPRSLEARANLAEIYRSLGDLRASVAELAAIVQAFPNHEETHRYQYLAAKDYFELRDWDQVVVEVNVLAERFPDSEYLDDAQLLVASSWVLQGDRQKALAAYDRFLERWPEGELAPRAMFEQARLYAENEQLEKSVDLLMRALQTHPTPKLVQAEIARIRRRIATLRIPPKVDPSKVWDHGARRASSH